MNNSQHLYFQLSSRGERREIAKSYQPSYIIGRRSTTGVQVNDIFLDDPYSSRKHCQLSQDDAGLWWVEDMGSSNGTKLNGQLITKKIPYPHRGVIMIGETRIVMGDHAIGEEDEEPAETVLMSMAAPQGREMVEETLLQARAPLPDATILDPSRDKTRMAPSSKAAGGGQADMTRVLPQPRPVQPAKPASLDSTLTRFGDSTLLADGNQQPGSAMRGTPPRPAGGVKEPKKPTHDTRMDATISAQPLHSDEELLRNTLANEFMRGLIPMGFIAKEEILTMLKQARKNGKTFFRVLWESMETRPDELERLFHWVHKTWGMELWDENSERELGERAVTTPWLTFDQAQKLGVVMLSGGKSPERFQYATVDPFELAIRSHLEKHEKREAEPVLVLPWVFGKTIKGLADQGREAKEAGEVIDFNNDAEVHYREHLSEVSVPEMINFFLFRSHRRGASDIHVEPTEDSLVVRIRVDGILHEEFSLPITFHKEVVSRLKIISGMDVAEKRRPQDGRFSRVILNSPIDVRVSSFPTVFGEKFVMRLLDKSALRPSIDKLNMLARDLVLLKEKIAAPHGLIMISGPTGSGKTTTLYSCLSSLDKESRNVLTVEDPVEYRLKGVHQMQVNHKLGVTFASGLRTILRQDPDVIMVGEIRDEETARMAVQASLTGHIVFSTIHTNDAVGVVTRLLDMSIEPFLVATSVSLAIAQRLVRSICPNPNCRTSISGTMVLRQLEADGITQQRLEELGVEVDPDNYYVVGKGCPECMFSGYQGRQAVFEIFEMTSQARSIIMASGFSADKLHALSREARMTTLIEHGMKLVEDEKTTFFEIIRVLGERN